MVLLVSKNEQIEFNLINSLKDFEISSSEFKELISFNKSKMGVFIYELFIHRYQAIHYMFFLILNNILRI